MQITSIDRLSLLLFQFFFLFFQFFSVFSSFGPPTEFTPQRIFATRIVQKKKSSSIQLVGYRFISTESIGKMGVAVGINENWQRWSVAKNNRQSVLLYL